MGKSNALGACVAGDSVVGLSVVGLSVVGDSVVGLSVVGDSVVGAREVGCSVGDAVAALFSTHTHIHRRGVSHSTVKGKYRRGKFPVLATPHT